MLSGGWIEAFLHWSLSRAYQRKRAVHSTVRIALKCLDLISELLTKVEEILFCKVFPRSVRFHSLDGEMERRRDNWIFRVHCDLIAHADWRLVIGVS